MLIIPAQTRINFYGNWGGNKELSRNHVTVVRCAAAIPTGADPQATDPATGVLRITPIDGFTARTAFITIKFKAAVATDKHLFIPDFGYDMN
jgi:uncharacterized metal-binding protein